MTAIAYLTLAALPLAASPAPGVTPGAATHGMEAGQDRPCCTPDPRRDPSPRTRELLDARLDALRQVEDVYRDLVRRGAVPEVESDRATLRRLRAELELTTGRPERIVLREQIVERTRRLEEWSAAAGFDRTARPGHLERRVERLEAEIDLERERESCSKSRFVECRCRSGR